MHHINRGGQIEMMVGRQVILESRLFGYHIPRQNQPSPAQVPPRYEVAVSETTRINNETLPKLNITGHENTRLPQDPTNYESRVFTIQQ